MALHWYVVHTYSGFELQAKKALEERVKTLGKQELIQDVFVPMEDVVEMKKGEKKTSSKKFFPGYLLVRMELNNDTWHLVKSIPKITGFVGGANNTPPAVTDEEVKKLTQQISEGTLKPKHRISFDHGESVRVIDGPFTNFNGVVDEVKPEKGKIKMLVSIFGRATPVELDFSQVEKN